MKDLITLRRLAIARELANHFDYVISSDELEEDYKDDLYEMDFSDMKRDEVVSIIQSGDYEGWSMYDLESEIIREIFKLTNK